MGVSVLPRLEDLSLEEKAGQVFMVGFPGRDRDGARTAICDLKVGGIAYFARNTGTVRETAALSAELQEMAAGSSGIPLLISADQEGGLVSRLTEGLPLMPGPMSLGAVGDPDLVRDVSRAIGTQIRAAGINVNLAPVLDVNDNPQNPVIGVRSFGSDPALVERLGTAAVRGYLDAGVAPVGKHFPGHGNTSVDSHLELPVLPHSMERLDRVELRPFRAAIRAGIPAIMTAHIVFHAVDPERPATLSEPVLNGLLRRKLGFGGVIMTDCLEMSAVSRNPGPARGAILALLAGADMLLLSHTVEYQREAYFGLIEAVRAGEVPQSRLDEAVKRVLTLKRALRIPNALPPDAADGAELRGLSSESHRRSITIVRDEGDSLPLRPSRAVAVVSAVNAAPLVETLETARIRVSSYGMYQSPATGGPPGAGSAGILDPEDAIASAAEGLPQVEAPNGSDTVILLTDNAWKDSKQAAVAQSILKDRPDAIVIALRDPYDLRVLPEAKTFICTYSRRPEALRAAAEVLLGKARAEGRLPLSLE
ncbi:MAG: glycoside hydrolase family 3 protein [Bacillota bacterium]|jgi:beta-N-acetylhexosaminidase